MIFDYVLTQRDLIGWREPCILLYVSYNAPPKRLRCEQIENKIAEDGIVKDCGS